MADSAFVEHATLAQLEQVEKAIDKATEEVTCVTDAELAKVRARTMAQRKAQYKKRQMHKSLGHGKFLEYDPQEFFMEPAKASGGAFLKESRENKTRVVICIYHKASKFCPYMDKCLTQLAMQHPETKFAKWDLEKISADHLGEKVFALMHRMFRYDPAGNLRLPYIYCINSGEKVHHFEGLDKFNGTGIKPEYVYAHLANIGMVDVKE